MDPARRDYWRYEPNSSHPEGPARLVHEEEAPVFSSCQAVKHKADAVPTVIHAGDRLVVEEHTTKADIRLSAVALAPAAIGKVLMARLLPGGRVVRVVAAAQGSALLAAAPGVPR